MCGVSYIPPTKEQFEAMDDAGKYVALATIARGLLVKGTIEADDDATYIGSEGVFPGTLPCPVCALGALAVAGMSIGLNRPWIHEFRQVGQNKTIEAAFEGFGLSGSATVEFYFFHSDPNERLLAICENIISNNGEFKPEATGGQS